MEPAAPAAANEPGSASSGLQPSASEPKAVQETDEERAKRQHEDAIRVFEEIQKKQAAERAAAHEEMLAALQAAWPAQAAAKKKMRRRRRSSRTRCPRPQTRKRRLPWRLCPCQWRQTLSPKRHLRL